MSKKKKMIQTFTFILLMSLMLVSQNINGLEDYGVTVINHTPETLHQNDILSVTVDFSDTTDIIFVKLIICQLEPQFLCEDSPIIMEETETNAYTGDFPILFDVGTLVGYHIQIVYTNDSVIFLPDSIDFLDADNIIEPFTGDFYYNASYVLEPPEETSNVNSIFLCISLAIISIVINKKRQNKHR